MINLRPTTGEDLAEALSQAIGIHCDEHSLTGHTHEGRTTLFSDIGILAVVEVLQMFPGVATVTCLFTNNIYSQPIALTRFMKKLLSFKMLDLGVHRVQIEVKVGYAAGHQFAKALGFEAEGTMKKFGPDKSDYVLYGKVI